MRRLPNAIAAASLALSLATPAGAQLTIRATVPPDTPNDGTVHVAGTFNRWDPGASRWALARGTDGVWTITLPDSVRGPLELKLTRGSWATVETTGSGADVPNRTITVPPSGAATLDVTVSGWRDRSARATSAPPRSTASPNVRVVRDSFLIPQLGRARRVWIYLPPGYAASTRRYPVLYLHDGQNVFDAATSFAGEWGVDESLDSLTASGDPGAIVVAVDNGGTHRMDEYDPWRSTDRSLGGGEGDAYVEFLARTLKPWVDAHYRTRPDAAHTGVMGSSMGGLISLYAALKYPKVFGRAGVFSCACWVADPKIFAYAREHARPARGTAPRLYFTIGALETPTGGPARDQRRMVDTLLAAGFPASAVQAVVAEDGKHAEWFWRREFPAAYRWLFGRDSLPGARPLDSTLTRATPNCAACADWNVPQRPFRIFGNAWWVGTHGLGAILLTSPGGHVLIDAALPESAPQIAANVRALGFRLEDVKLVVNSHAHFDHAGGIEALRRASGARVAASPPSARWLAAGGIARDDPQAGIVASYPKVPTVRVLADGETVRVAGVSLTARFTPGHTPGGTTWTWRSCEGDRCLDLVYADSQTPVSADGFSFAHNTTYPNAVRDFERGFAVLEGLSCDVLLTPHPGASQLWERVAARDSGNADALVDREACRRYAAAGRAALARRLATERAAR